LQRISEQRTRREIIDPQLEKAGWYVRELMSEAVRHPGQPRRSIGGEGLFQRLLSEAFNG
jgi:type I site-specific restriction endonuclease